MLIHRRVYLLCPWMQDLISALHNNYLWCLSTILIRLLSLEWSCRDKQKIHWYYSSKLNTTGDARLIWATCRKTSSTAALPQPNILLISSTSGKSSKQLTQLYFLRLKKSIGEQKSLLILHEMAFHVYPELHRKSEENN